MTINAGVWIDHHKAVVVLLTDEGQEMLQILSDRNVSARSPAGLRAKNSYTPNDFVSEGKRERKVMMHLYEYYDEVIACVRDAQAILILGPGEAKGEFRKRIASQKLRGHVAEMKTVAKLTDQQIADYVRQHFQ
jgi:stalled ribosome rescue protein Dom34